MGRRRTKGLNIVKNRISEMPDEILSAILLSLTLKEAARTSVLSCRWRFLWKNSVSLSSSFKLDILAMRGSDYPDKMFQNGLFGDDNVELLSAERKKFVDWVDMILQLDYRPMMETFRLRYYLEKDSAHHFNRWINMAISKRVENFDIDLSHFHGWGFCRQSEEKLCTYPDWLFAQGSRSIVKRLFLKSCILTPLDFSCFSSVLDLQLDSVAVSQDNFDSFLSNCCNLEKLCLVRCCGLHSVKISGSFLKLKYLAIVNCRLPLAYIEIDSRNLARLEYHGKQVEFSFRNLSKLSDAIIHLRSPDFSAALNYVLHKFSRHVPNLKSLQLHVFLIKRVIVPIHLANMKKLVLMVNAFEGSLWGVIPLLHASPCLDTLELNWWLSSSKSDCEAELMRKPKPPGCQHRYLNDIVLSGFTGSAHEMEFTKHLLDNSPALEKITVIHKSRTSYNYLRGKYLAEITTNFEDARVANQELINILPPQVKLCFS